MALFDKSYEKVPELLNGRILRVQGKALTLVHAEGFSRLENERGVYRPITDMKPGDVYCPSVQGHIMTLIACRDGMRYGGCVLIREVHSSTGGIFNRPSHVSREFRIAESKSKGSVFERADGDLELRMESGKASTILPAKNQRQQEERGINKSVVTRLMPLITKAWLARGQGESLQVFITGLLARSTTERALLRELKS